jgi:inner membrane protein
MQFQRFQVWGKAGAMVAVTLGLWWALASVQSLVHERQARQLEAEQSVTNSLAGKQTLLGPALVRTCSETWVKGHEEGGERKALTDSAVRVIRLPARQLNMDARVEMAPRHRGIFKVNGYVTQAKLVATWPELSALTPAPQHEQGQVSCGPAIVTLSVSDARGIQLANVEVNDQAAVVKPGSGLSPESQGFHAVLPEAALNPASATDATTVTVNLELAGTRSIAVAPIADATTVKLASDWRHPAFGGRFLPSERHLGEQGFDATWRVTSLASTAQQAWLKGATPCAIMASGEPQLYTSPSETEEAGEQGSRCVESFGVSFMDPVNPYVLSDRATKYGMLFVVLTFVGVGLTEALKRLRVHPIQYLLVGAALAVFFLLLLSLSEHLRFGLAYLIAGGACTALLSFYGAFVLRGMRAGGVFGAGIAALFATLYTLLQLEQTALMLGSLLLFFVLMLIMVSTRRLDWYALSGQAHESQP